MDEFFEIWDVAKDRYGLSRLVQIDQERGLIKVWQGDVLIIKVEAEHDENEHLYSLAAERLISWIQKGRKHD